MMKTNKTVLSQICGMTFGKLLKLKEHFRVNHRNLNPDGSVHEVLPYRCHLCREVFQQGPVLGQHLTTAHPNETPDGGSVAAASALASLATPPVTPVVAAPPHPIPIPIPIPAPAPQSASSPSANLTCPVCEQTGFSRPQGLTSHIRKVHGQEYLDNNPDLIQQAAAAAEASKASNKLPPKDTAAAIMRMVRKPGPASKRQQQQQRSPFSGGLDLTEPRAGQKNFAYDESTIEPPMITIRPVTANSTAPRRPGPASRTNAPAESRASAVPSHVEPSQLGEASSGYDCGPCGKVLQTKKVIHGNFYGEQNKWKGHSSVVDMILEESAKLSPSKNKRGSSGVGGGSSKSLDANACMCSVCQAVFPNPSSLRNHVVNVHIQGQDHTCDLCGKAYLSNENLEAHIKAKHPNLDKRLKSLRESLGLHGPTAAKRARLELGISASSLGGGDGESGGGGGKEEGAQVTLQEGKDGEIKTDRNNNVPLALVKSSSTSETGAPSSEPASADGAPASTNPLPSNTVLSITAEKSPSDPPVDLSTTSVSRPSSPSSLSSTVLSSRTTTAQPIVVDFPRDCPNNNNEGEGAQQPAAATGGRKKNSICKICGVVLSPKTNVNVHMRTHSGARPYQCVLCLNRFRQKAHLMKHFRCSHNQKRPPFVCLFCPDECASSNDLYRHITDRHEKETDDLLKANGLQKDQDIVGDMEMPPQAQSPVVVPAPQMVVTAPQPPPPQLPQSPVPPPQEPHPIPMSGGVPLGVSLPTQPLQEMQQHAAQVLQQQHEEQQQQQQQHSPQEEEDNIRYEPITEAFVFEDQIIHPCYVVLPFVADADVEVECKRPITVRKTWRYILESMQSVLSQK